MIFTLAYLPIKCVKRDIYSEAYVLGFRTGGGALSRSLLPASAPSLWSYWKSWLTQLAATPFSGELPIAKRKPP